MEINDGTGRERATNYADAVRAAMSGEATLEEAVAAIEAVSSAREAALADLAHDVLWRRRISDEEADQLAVEGYRRRYYRAMGGAPYERATRGMRPSRYDAGEFAGALAREMDACAMGPTKLAEKAGISRQVVYEYLDGSSSPSLPTLCKVCSALGCEPSALLERPVDDGELPA